MHCPRQTGLLPFYDKNVNVMYQHIPSGPTDILLDMPAEAADHACRHLEQQNQDIKNDGWRCKVNKDSSIYLNLSSQSISNVVIPRPGSA